MPTIEFAETKMSVENDETVLDALLRHGHSIPYSCRSGVCQSCLLKATDGEVPGPAQQGLKPSLAAQGMFLSCVARPLGNLSVKKADHLGVASQAQIDRVDRLSESVSRVFLRYETEFHYQAGQYISVVRQDGLARSYSIANPVDDDRCLQLHVRIVPKGEMSPWLGDPRNVGEIVNLRGPAGDCIYHPAAKDQELLLVGTGTGLAPLWGIVQDALQQQHAAPIHLYHGSRDAAGLYMCDELEEFSRQSALQFHYHRCVLSASHDFSGLVGSLDDVVLRRHPSLEGVRVYLCGAPEFVLPMRKRAFLAGAHSKQIHADAFLPTKHPASVPTKTTPANAHERTTEDLDLRRR